MASSYRVKDPLVGGGGQSVSCAAGPVARVKTPGCESALLSPANPGRKITAARRLTLSRPECYTPRGGFPHGIGPRGHPESRIEPARCAAANAVRAAGGVAPPRHAGRCAPVGRVLRRHAGGPSGAQSLVVDMGPDGGGLGPPGPLRRPSPAPRSASRASTSCWSPTPCASPLPPRRG